MDRMPTLDFSVAWSRGTVKSLDINVFKILARLRLELRLQAGEGNMSVNVPTESTIDIGVPLGNCTVPLDSVTETAMDVPEFAEWQSLELQHLSPKLNLEIGEISISVVGGYLEGLMLLSASLLFPAEAGVVTGSCSS